MHFIVGTAGHVDHGKTSLIRALTGIETDRLREEKERGLSIVPGFAHLQLPPTEYLALGRDVGIVDVPGHERFLKNMLTGASGVDIAVLVIAADEGVMPQTREHLRVLELLDIKRGVIALSKIDLVEDDWRAMIRDDVRAQLASTRFVDAPLIEVSATRGDGLDELKKVLAQICDELDSHNSQFAIRHPFRLPVDRAFSIGGFGTVVTGSLLDDEMTVGENVEVWRPEASTPLAARVRGLEVHGRNVERAFAGQRVAANLAGVSLDEDLRGGLLCAPSTLHASATIETHLQILEEAPRALKDDASIRLHRGASEVGAKVLLHDVAKLERGQNGFARLRLEAPLPLARGDRFVLRELSSERVLGGGVVLETQKLSRGELSEGLPLLKAALEAQNIAALAEILLRCTGARGLSESDLRFELHCLDASGVLASLREKNLLWQSGELFLHAGFAAQLKDKVLASLEEFHARAPLQSVMPREALRASLAQSAMNCAPATFDALLEELSREEKIEISSSGARLFARRVEMSEEEKNIAARLEKICDEAAWQPPSLDELANQFPRPALARKLCFALMESGQLARVGDFVFSMKRLEEAKQKLCAHFGRQSTLSVGEARELLSSSRKWMVPLLEYFDKNGLTRREGDARVLKNSHR